MIAGRGQTPSGDPKGGATMASPAGGGLTPSGREMPEVISDDGHDS
jgi:hypothetical protein